MWDQKGESTTWSARSLHTMPRPHAILSILLSDDSNICGATGSVLNIYSPSARLYISARKKHLNRFISVEGWSLLRLTHGILAENLGPTGCAIFSHQGASRWWPRHTACFLGRKLLSSQKHKRSRMYKGVTSCVEEKKWELLFIPRQRKKMKGVASLKRICRLGNQEITAARSDLSHWCNGLSTPASGFLLAALHDGSHSQTV